MKITNKQMVTFMNVSGSILQLKIPKKLYSAIALNRASLKDTADVYTTQQDKLIDQYVKKDDKKRPIVNGNEYAFIDRDSYYRELEELLGIEHELNLQAIGEDLFDKMDEMEKFDSLSGVQYSCIDFMVSRAEE